MRMEVWILAEDVIGVQWVHGGIAPVTSCVICPSRSGLKKQRPIVLCATDNGKAHTRATKKLGNGQAAVQVGPAVGCRIGGDSKNVFCLEYTAIIADIYAPICDAIIVGIGYDRMIVGVARWGGGGG